MQFYKHGVSAAVIYALCSTSSFADFPTSYFTDFNDGLPAGWSHSETSDVNWEAMDAGLYGNALTASIDSDDFLAEINFSETTEAGRFRFIYSLEQTSSNNAYFNVELNGSTEIGRSWKTDGFIIHEASSAAGRTDLVFRLSQSDYNPSPAKASIDSFRFIANSIDADRDFMADSWESTHGFDSTNSSDALTDADNDGLINELEYWYQTDPNESDSDGDSLDDRYETLYGLDPLNSSDGSDDLDSDGLTNAEEFAQGTNPAVTDTDSDGLSDFDEVNTHNTNPTFNDSDGDGYRDGYEISIATDPLDQSSHPTAIKKLHETFEEALGSQWQSVVGKIEFERVNHTAYIGQYGLMPGTDFAQQDSAIKLVENFDQGKLQFRYRLNSQSTLNSDYSSNIVVTTSDGLNHNTHSHEQNWEVLSLNINQGTDYILFEFETNSSWQDNNEVVIDEVRYLSITLDSDRDLMDDEWEVANYLNPDNAYDANEDSDSDGLTNQDEYWSGTSPFNTDSDDDGLPDGWEVNHGLDPNSDADASLDNDGDTLTNLQEFEYGSHPLLSDSDGDSLLDADEINTHNTDPSSADTDNDGLNDDVEIAGTHGTDAIIADTDSDGVLDGGEVLLGYDPTDNNSAPQAIEFVKENFNDSAQLTLVESEDNQLPWTFEASSSSRPWNLRYSTIVPSGESASLLWNGYFRAGSLSFNASTNSVQYEVFINGTSVSTSYYSSFQRDLGEGAYSIEIRATSSSSHYDGRIALDNLHFLADSRDTDNNQLDDIWQGQYGLGSYGYRDTDDDDLRDEDEYWLDTNPIIADTDSDGMPDGFENYNSLNPLDATDGALDQDNDGLTNAEEYGYSSQIDREDSDWDGLSDYEEAKVYFTALNSSDTDNDSLEDGVEVLTYFTSPTDKDTDGDSFDDAVEIRYSSDPLNENLIPEVMTDRFYSFENGLPSDFTRNYGTLVKVETGVVDGDFALSIPSSNGSFEMSDVFADVVVSVYAESNNGYVHLSSDQNSVHFYENESGVLSTTIAQGEDRIYLGLTNHSGENPPTIDSLSIQLIDQDGDLIPNYWEHFYNLNPFDETDGQLDLDADGLTNADEFLSGTELNNNDTDDDGLPDGWERNHGTKPLETDASADYDGDSVSNLDEHEAGTHPLMQDSDQDGLPDGWEIQFGLDPISKDGDSDFDNDGLTNLEEFLRETDPTVITEVENNDQNNSNNAGSFGLGIGLLLTFLVSLNRRKAYK